MINLLIVQSFCLWEILGPSLVYARAITGCAAPNIEHASISHSTRWHVTWLSSAVQPSDGSTALHQRGRLDLTVTAMVVDNAKEQALVTREELDQARCRLIATTMLQETLRGFVRAEDIA
jgi:hypothetical protein